MCTGGEEPKPAQDVHENQNPTFKFRGGSYWTHLKTSLGRTGLGRLLGGGGLTALSSLTSFASFAGLGWVGNNVEERESLELGQS